MVDGRFSNLVVSGCWLTLLSFVLILLAFSTPHWLETDGTLEEPRFTKLGLWSVCFNKFTDPLHFYDIEFTGCRWVLDEEYQIIDDTVRPGFFVAVQLFFSLCFIASLVSCALTVVFVCCTSEQYEIVFLRVLSLALLVAGFCGIIATITFGALGDSRYWMPDYLHNNLSWSFALGVTGSVLSFFGALMFWVEARREVKRTGIPKGAIFSADV